MQIVSVTFILDIFGRYGRHLGENVIGRNSKFQLQYKLNETDHHSKFFLYVLPNKRLCS